MSSAQHLLNQFESQWLRNEIPEVSAYLHSCPSADVTLWHNLIELDLEYRWKRYSAAVTKTERDLHGFPQFPRLEDYAQLVEEAQRQLILTPELLAEEYRVRRFWGDRPEKEEFLERLPLESHAVESALNQIETEFEIERTTPVEEEDSSHLSDESTFLVGHQKKNSRETALDKQPLKAVGKYQLESLLGKGGFGEVWKAYDPDLRRHVALKLPRHDKQFTKEILDYFRSEAQKMATLERVPGVVPVFEAGEFNQQVYIVSYLVSGNDLGRRLQSSKLSYAESARIVATVAETLHRAHLKNLFHRDVKLSNILISDDGEIFLTDFGLCVTEEEQLKERQSTTGTYAYMAPEQVQGFSHRLDGRADIYALGVVLYRLLTGRLPFIADTPQEYLQQVLLREPRPLRSIKDDIPAELERICLKCLNKDIGKRYTTAADLAQELKEWNAVSLEQSKRKVQISLIAACAVILAGIAIWYTSRPVSSVTTPGTRAENTVPPVVPAEVTDSKSILVEELAFPVGGADSVWQPLNSGHSLHVQSNWLSLLKLGETEEQASFEVDISQLNWKGNIGLFYGYKENVVKGFLRASYYVVEIVPDSESHYLLVHSHKSHPIQNPSVVESDHLETWIIGQIDAKTVNIRLALSPDTKCVIFCDGERVSWDEPASETQFNAIDVSGSYGVYNYVSSGTYHNLKIDDVVRNFKKNEE